MATDPNLAGLADLVTNTKKPTTVPPGGTTPPSEARAPDPRDPPATQVETRTAPKTEADASQTEPVTFKMKDSRGQPVEYTEAQINAVLDRYRDLNGRHASLKPVIELFEQIREKGGIGDDKMPDLVRYTADALLKKANAPIQPGKDTDGKEPAPTGPTPHEKLKQWADTNGVEIPPGMVELTNLGMSLPKFLEQQNQLIQALMAKANGAASHAQQAVADANATKADGLKRRLVANLSMVQQKLALPDDAFQPFMAYAQERGYIPEADFQDANLLMKVANDFKAVMAQPEYDRLRNIAARRSAVTMTAGASPGGAGAGAPPAQNPDLAAMTDYAMQRRRDNLA